MLLGKEYGPEYVKKSCKSGGGKYRSKNKRRGYINGNGYIKTIHCINWSN